MLWALFLPVVSEIIDGVANLVADQRSRWSQLHRSSIHPSILAGAVARALAIRDRSTTLAHQAPDLE